MSKPRYIWWSYVKAVIRLYKPPDRVGVGTLTKREMDAVSDAIGQTESLPDGEGRMNLLNLVFWSKTHTLAGAAMEVHCSYRTAQEWHKQFILLVAKNLGLL